MITRRRLLAALPLLAIIRPAQATPEEMAQAIAAYTQNAKPQKARVEIDIAKLIDNGNAVPITVRVASPMTEQDHVTDFAIFNEKNPLPDVVRFQLTAASGKAEISTRIRLATSQHITALARTSDGQWWQQSIDVIVTLAACIEGEAI
ncbi:SoxY-related AACIE arm protein [Pseudoduganella sp. DS3]|uniref:SoxY-related AACIE arm protein n=1 Tax=Pseudoduganella guangdongensis TaxID=2692179 RepID=A0A6N9HKX8_9BURK|nr:SoxY-related AACIE arm protein [Pseudoduganella guangdongensis]MYN04264.1 SoxY-related AACIE arm protein [Pseudoduganella guangdongensis]